MRAIVLVCVGLVCSFSFIGCGEMDAGDGPSRRLCSEQCVGATPHCDRETLMCVECMNTSQCSGDDECVSGECIPPHDSELVVDNVTVSEGANTLQFVIRLVDGPQAQDVSVQYSTSDGSAKKGQDYIETTGTFTIRAGVASLPVSVPLIQDGVPEPTESFAITVMRNASSLMAGVHSSQTVATSGTGSITDEDSVEAISASNNSCAIKVDGSLWCWGYNGYGQFGDGSFSPKSIPVRVGTDSDWQQATQGQNHLCAIKTNGSLWCLGANAEGQLGDGTTSDRKTPTRIGTDTDWKIVSSNAYATHTCAIKSNSTLWCWGSNIYGQIGDGTTNTRTSPTQVGNYSDWSSVDAGVGHNCATTIGGTLWCWGGNSGGMLGDGTTIDRSSPVRVGTASNWAEISCGAGHNCATTSSGALWCWGVNTYGQLGDGTHNNALGPRQVGSASDWKSPALGFYHACAAKNNGTLWCWGRNDVGQLGTGNTIEKNIATQVGSGTNWEKGVAGEDHKCALKSDGTVSCWGENGLGAVGDGTFSDRNIPTPVAFP